MYSVMPFVDHSHTFTPSPRKPTAVSLKLNLRRASHLGVVGSLDTIPEHARRSSARKSAPVDGTFKVWEPTSPALVPLSEKPSFEQLMATLEKLKIQPASFEHKSATKTSGLGDEKDITRYLEQIIKSDFTWIAGPMDDEDSEDKVDMIIDAASKRLAERCGRTAMPEMVRTWTIPRVNRASPELKIQLREPPMTGDGDTLGLKTWGTSFLIAKRLETIGEEYFSDEIKENGIFLELGSGTGLFGITAAALWGRLTILSDLPEIMDNLNFNADMNSVINGQKCSLGCDVLDWNHPELSQFGDKFDLILASDPFYDHDHPRMLTETIKANLKGKNEESCVIVAVPLRDDLTKMLRVEFELLMVDNGFWVEGQTYDVCYDDWVVADDEDDGGVKCWWGLFKYDFGQDTVFERCETATGSVFSFARSFAG